MHGSPLSDVESFPAEPGDDDERMLNGVRDKTVVFGHSHLQFKRPGPNGTTLINPGSAGMPLDGDVRAAYALRHDDGEFEFRRVDYDVERAAQAWERHAGLVRADGRGSGCGREATRPLLRRCPTARSTSCP